MKEKYVHIFIAGCLLAAAASTSFAAYNSFQGLGDLPGGDFSSIVHGVSADGSVVVGASNTGTTEDEAFRWTAAAGMQGLGYLPGGQSFSSAFASSPDGSVVTGWSGSKVFRWVDLNGNGTVELSEKLDNNAGFGLGDFPGTQPKSIAFDLSADSSIIVGASAGPSGLEAFRWKDQNGNGLIDPDEQLDGNYAKFGFGDFPTGIFASEARNTTPNGSVVVGMANSDRGEEAYRWTEFNSNGVIDLDEKLDNNPEFGLGHLAGGTDGSAAYDVSANAAVVVGWANSDSGQEAFRWEDLDLDGVVDSEEKLDVNPQFALGDLPGGQVDSTAYAVSADGSVVVGYGTTDNGRRAFIWDTVNGMRSLQSILVSDWGLDLGSWMLLEARGISADGLTIVGIGINPNGDTEGWIANIPEITTMTLLGLGGLALIRRRSQ